MTVRLGVGSRSVRRSSASKRRPPRPARPSARTRRVVRVGAHHVGRRRPGSPPPTRVCRCSRQSAWVSGDGPRRRVAAGKTPRNAVRAAADPPRQRRDRGAGQQHPADQQHQDGEDPRPDRAEQVGRGRSRPRSRPCRPPSRRRGRRRGRRRRRPGRGRSGRGGAARGRRAGAARAFGFGALWRVFPGFALRAGARFLRTNMVPRFDAERPPLRAKFALKAAGSGVIRGLTSIAMLTEADPSRRPRPRRRGRRRDRRRPAPLAAQRGLRGAAPRPTGSRRSTSPPASSPTWSSSTSACPAWTGSRSAGACAPTATCRS